MQTGRFSLIQKQIESCIWEAIRSGGNFATKDSASLTRTHVQLLNKTIQSAWDMIVRVLVPLAIPGIVPSSRFSR